MLKFLGILLFLIVTSVAPYASSQGSSFSLAQNPEEFDFNTANLLEEKIEPHEYEIIIHQVQTDYIEFPAWILLKPQTIPEDSHKPPCCRSII